MWQDPTAARDYLEEGVRLWRQFDSPWHLSRALLALGHVLTMLGELQTAREYLEETLALRRPLGHRMGLASALDSLGRVVFRMGHYDEAEEFFEEGLALAQEAGDIGSMAFSLHGMGQVARRLGDLERAKTFYIRSIELRLELGDRRGVADSLISLVDVLAAQGLYAQASRMSGLADAVCEAIGVDLYLTDHQEHERSLAELRLRLGPEQFSRLQSEGKHLSVEQAIKLESAPGEPAPASRAAFLLTNSDDVSLTPRELEVLRMIAMGMTNVQTASTLSISPHTVNMHVRSIFTKLGVTSRSAATRYAIVNGLI
jgi:DNA-binding CsgD family transcriptional regulator/Tfp pilus assembly protein PilF